jgi:O-antigen/teichoic acid export membrane protein
MSMKRSLGYYLSAQGGGLLFGLGNAVLSAQILGTEGKGQLAIYILALEMGLVLLMLGMNQALQHHASRDDFRSQRPLNSVLVFGAVCATLFFVIVQVAFLVGQGDRVLPAPFNTQIFRGFIALHFFLMFFATLLGSILNSYKLFEYSSKASLISIAFVFSLYVGFFILDRQESYEVLVNYFYFGLAFSAILNLGLLLRVYFKWVPAAGAVPSWELLSRSKVLKLAAFGLFPWISQFMMRAVLKLDYWFVEGFVGLESLGLYSVASNIGETLYLVPNTIGVVVLSYIADPETRDDSTHRTATMCRLFFPTMIVGALVVSPFSSDLFGLAFGPEFRASGPLFNMLLWGIVPFSLATIIIGYLTGAEQLKQIVVAAAMALGLTVVLDLVLVPRMGAMGAAITRVIALNIMTWYLVVCFRRTSGLPYKRFLWPSRADAEVIRAQFRRRRG